VRAKRLKFKDVVQALPSAGDVPDASLLAITGALLCTKLNLTQQPIGESAWPRPRPDSPSAQVPVMGRPRHLGEFGLDSRSSVFESDRN
jgi:hypothetical protein